MMKPAEKEQAKKCCAINVEVRGMRRRLSLYGLLHHRVLWLVWNTWSCKRKNQKKPKPNCLSEDGEEMEKGPDGHNCGMFLGTKGLGEVPLGVPGGYQT